MVDIDELKKELNIVHDLAWKRMEWHRLFERKEYAEWYSGYQAALGRVRDYLDGHVDAIGEIFEEYERTKGQTK